MTLFNVDTLKAPASRSTRHLLVAVSAFSLMGISSFATAQASTPQNASDQKTTTQAQQPSETPAAEIEDKYKPRVYGSTQPTVAVPAPQSIPGQTPQTLPNATVNLPKTEVIDAEQQVNIVTNDAPSAATNDAITEISTIVNPDLPTNDQLNSSPNWADGIRSQFVDVIVGAPIMEDPTTCEDGNPSLRIKVSNVKKSKGIIVADLHDDVKENFLDWEKVVLRVRATATKDETFFCMPVPKAGTYAVAIYHDKNSNAFFDKNFLGLPKERFGMSQNPKFSTKSPKFEEAIFEVPAEGVEMEIKLRRTSDVLSGNQD